MKRKRSTLRMMSTERGPSFITSRKSQITIFIIIGLLLIAALGVFLALREQVKEIELPEERVARVPLQAKPINAFIESCVQSVATEAIKKMGQHGGYINPLEEKNPGTGMKFDPQNPTDSDGLTLVDDPSTAVVYWWYLKTPNNCFNCLLSDERAPAISSVETQVDEYLKNNIDACLNKFESFKAAGFAVTKRGDLVAKTTVTENDVLVVVRFPITVALGAETTDLTDFVARVPIRLKDMLEVATAVADAEATANFLEYVGKMLISYNSALDTSKLPPIYAREESYVPKIWIKPSVESQVKDLLTSYIPLVQINATKGAAPIPAADPFTRGIYKSFFFPTLNASFVNYSVRFYYLDWPIYLHITPNSGGIYEASRVTAIERSLLGFPSIVTTAPTREYEFFYDLSFPVLVEVRNNEDLYGEGFTWLFALEANIRDNRGVRQWFEGNGTWGPYRYNLYSLGAKSEVLQSDFGKKHPALAPKTAKTLFCNRNQLLSGNVTVVVRDAENKTSLVGVSVVYSCGAYAGCPMGMTAFDEKTNESRFVSPFPICIGGGILTLKKQGYETKTKIDISTKPTVPLDIEEEMQHVYEKEVKVKKLLLNRNILYRRPLGDHGNTYIRFMRLSGATADINLNSESVILTVRRSDGDKFGPPSAQTIVFDKTKDDPILHKITLVPGTYEVRTTYINMQESKIPPEYRCEDGDEDCFWIPEPPGVKMDASLGGGLELVNSTGYWIVSLSDLKKGNVVLFTILQLPPPLVVEDLSEFGKLEDYSKQFRSLLQPAFS
ncbi:hypothetical protein HY772_07445 [Candidatus Woesearchaeota archaeon]|nr:hypothetical protein [Candidatus Woesearchaeota archaeon]